MQVQKKREEKREEKASEVKPEVKGEVKPATPIDEGETNAKYVEWRDVLYTGPNVIYGPPLVGKSRFAWAIMAQLRSEGKKALYMVTEPNLSPIMDQLRKVLDGVAIEVFDNPYQVREYVRLLYVRRKWVRYDFIALDSLAGLRENYAFMYGSGKLRDVYEANRLTTEVVWGLSQYANFHRVPILVITHETPGINRTCFGKPTCPTASTHAMYAVSSVMYMFKVENKDEEGNVVSIERVIEVVDHRYRPELVGCRVRLLEPPL